MLIDASQMPALAASHEPGIPSRPFLAHEVHAAGLTKHALRRLVEEGTVRRALREVYVPAHLPDDLHHRVAAASLVMPAHAVLADRSAAWIWGVDAFEPFETAAVPQLEAFVLPGHKRLTRPEAAGGERTLSERDLTRVGPIRVTSPLRTACDLGRLLGPATALAAMDALARAQGVKVCDLLAALPRFRGYRGIVQLRRLAPLVDARAESPGESFTRWTIIDAGLPTPEPQVWVDVAGVPTYRLDLAYRRQKVCVEYDGEEFHSSPERREADRRRRAWLQAQGWHVIVVDRGSFRGAAREAWLAELAQVLRERSARPRW